MSILRADVVVATLVVAPTTYPLWICPRSEGKAVEERGVSGKAPVSAAPPAASKPKRKPEPVVARASPPSAPEPVVALPIPTEPAAVASLPGGPPAILFGPSKCGGVMVQLVSMALYSTLPQSSSSATLRKLRQG